MNVEGTDLILYGFDLDGYIEDLRESRNVGLLDIGTYLVTGPVGAFLKKGYEMADMYQNLDRSKHQRIDALVFDWHIENGKAHTRTQPSERMKTGWPSRETSTFTGKNTTG